MAYEKVNVTMSDNITVVLHKWVPARVKAVVVLSHGMAEHALRYEELAAALNKKSIALYAEDHRGHGETAFIAEKMGWGTYGYLAEKNGFERVVDDIHEEILLAHKEFPKKKIFLFGHSFGSFVAQRVCEKYGSDIDSAIICGSAGPRLFLTRTGVCIANIVKFFKGSKSISKFLDGLALGSNNAKIKNPRTSVDWLTRDEEQVDKYIKDDLCGFTCKTGFFCDLFKGLSTVHTKSNMDRIPKTLPVFLIAGTDDPVGSYGKTVSSLYKWYKKLGIQDVSIKLYEGGRHELLNETNKQEVIADIIDFYTKYL